MAKASDYLIAFDGGHGKDTAGKRTPFLKSLGRQIHEHEFNQPVANLFEAELKRCGFRTIQLAPGDADIPLKSRTDDANKTKANLYTSIHFNASDGKFDGDSKDPSGFSAHIYPGSRNKPAGQFATIALKYLSQGTAQKNRGIVEQDLHITRETKMPAVLFELGFMDNEKEAQLMLSDTFQKECASELAKAVCEFYGVPYVADMKEVKAATVTKGTYRIKTGTFKTARSLADAIDRMRADFGYLAYEATDSTSFNPTYRIYTGTFPTKEDAESAQSKIESKYGWSTYLIDETK